MAKRKPASEKKRVLLLVVLSGVALLAAYLLSDKMARLGVAPADVRREAAEALEAAQDYATDNRETFQESVAAEADAIQKELNEFEIHALRSTQETARHAKVEMEQLLAKRLQAIDARLRDLREKSTELSEEARGSMDARIREMERQKEAVFERLAALKGSDGRSAGR